MAKSKARKAYRQKTTGIPVTYFNYPNEPIGGGNPYYRCCACGVSDPQINGRLEGHLPSCSWANKHRGKYGTEFIDVPRQELLDALKYLSQQQRDRLEKQEFIK